MGRKSVSALKRKMHFVIRAWLEEAVIRCNGSSFFMFYQHPTPTPKSPLTPRGDFDFFFAAGCFWVWCPLHSAIVNPAALPLLTVAPYARPLPGAKRWG